MEAEEAEKVVVATRVHFRYPDRQLLTTSLLYNLLAADGFSLYVLNSGMVALHIAAQI